MNKHHERSVETQARILNAAETTFAQLGYDGTSVSAICQAAGVSKGAFYHHFNSKQALFLQLLDRWLAGMDAAMSLLGESSADVPERIMGMSGIISQLLRVREKELLLYLEFLNKAARDPEVWREIIKPYHRYRTAFAELLEQGNREGSLRQIDPAAGSALVIGLAIGLLIQGFLDPEGADWTSVSREGIGIMLTGLKR
ncbi:MAG: TetR/AcrR family transcriptional regulator [Chloroflexota bacterium]|jgi:AcrR family transcriptional regulator